jgi:hypothetical protein
VAWWRLNRTVRFAGPFCAVVRTLLLFNVWWWLATRILSRHAGHYHTFEEWRAGVRDIAFSGPLGRLCWPAFAPLWNPVRDSLEWLYPKLPAIAPWHSLSSWNIALAVLAFVWAALDFSIPADSTVLGPRKLRFRLSSALGGAMSGMLRAAFVWALLIYSLLTYVPSLSDSAGAVQFFGTAASWRAVFFLALFGLTSVSARFVTALDVSRSVSPPESLRMDRKADATEMLLDMAILATLFFLWSGREIALSYGIYALVAISVKLVTGGGTRASRSYVEARILLAGSRLMPWRMMGFLVDAHRRGALRQVGAVYEFRHVRLQERLAAPHGRWSRRLDALARHVVGERIAESVIRPLRRSVEMLQSALSAVAAYVTRMVHTRGEKSARAHGWQTTGRGFVRSYRDPRFDALSAGQIDSETGPRAGG